MELLLKYGGRGPTRQTEGRTTILSIRVGMCFCVCLCVIDLSGRQLSEQPLSPPMLEKRIGAGLGRHLRGGMQIFVKTKNSQDQMRIGRQQSSAGFLPRKPTRPPARSLPGMTACRGKTLAGPPGEALAKCISREIARPTPAKSSPPFACSC